MIQYHGNIETVEFANWALGQHLDDVMDRARAEATKEALRQEYEEDDSELFFQEALAYELEDLFNEEFANVFGSTPDYLCAAQEPFFATLAVWGAVEIDFNRAAELVYEERLKQAVAAVRAIEAGAELADFIPFQQSA